jgi:hypothetical protein
VGQQVGRAHGVDELGIERPAAAMLKRLGLDEQFGAGARKA